MIASSAVSPGARTAPETQSWTAVGLWEGRSPLSKKTIMAWPPRRPVAAQPRHQPGLVVRVAQVDVGQDADQVVPVDHQSHNTSGHAETRRRKKR